MIIELSVPSKTFLLGEYAVIKGRPALVLTTDKRFKLIATRQQGQHQLRVEGIHLDSPAGKLIQSDLLFYQNYHIKFIDPYNSLGGFGASGAQFLMLYALKHYANKIPINDEKLLTEYLKFSWDNQGSPPSGADLIAQLHGGICFYHKANHQLQVLSWPFINLEYCLIHTGNKLATHTHLKLLSNKFDENSLEKIIFSGLQALEQSNSKSFIAAINTYASALESQGLVAKQSLDLLRLFKTNPHILAAKGCGALGADVVLIIYNKENQQDVLAWLKKHHLNVLINGQNVAKGLDIHVCELQKGT